MDNWTRKAACMRLTPNVFAMNAISLEKEELVDE